MKINKINLEKVQLVLEKVGISGQEIVPQANFFATVRQAVESYVYQHQTELDLTTPTIEGESKKIYCQGRWALVELKPTLYSFTSNRYGVVEGTDQSRLKFWDFFGSRLNQIVSDHLFGSNFEPLVTDCSVFDKSYPFLSNFLGTVTLTGKNYVIIRFLPELPPLEIVWKNYLLGTMKHNLKLVDTYPAKDGQNLNYEQKLPHDLIRFDWRNPLPNKDECIPDDFAEFYINTTTAKKVALMASRLLNKILHSRDYELVDLCYFMNSEGNLICSEITPDGMRIRKKSQSYDKDLWRQGKDRNTILTVWGELYEDLSA